MDFLCFCVRVLYTVNSCFLIFVLFSLFQFTWADHLATSCLYFVKNNLHVTVSQKQETADIQCVCFLLFVLVSVMSLLKLRYTWSAVSFYCCYRLKV